MILNFKDNPDLMATHRAVCAELGITTGERRADAAGDTAFLARELEFNSAQSTEVLTDPIKGRLLVPFTPVPDGAETFSYDMFDRLALVEWSSNYASAVGSADFFRKRFYKPMYDFQGSYHYSVIDLQRAAYAKQPIDRQRALSCRIGHEQFLDDVIANGDATRAIEGLLDNSAFQAVAPSVAFTVAGDDGSEAKSLAVLANLEKLVEAPEQNSKQNFTADTLVLPLSYKSVLKKRYSSNDARSREKVFLENQDSNGIKSITYWARLDTASALSGPRALAYKKSPMVLEFLMAYDYRELPPQAVGLAYQVNTMGRVGGLVVRYPLACAKMDLDATP